MQSVCETINGTLLRHVHFPDNVWLHILGYIARDNAHRLLELTTALQDHPIGRIAQDHRYYFKNLKSGSPRVFKAPQWRNNIFISVISYIVVYGPEFLGKALLHDLSLKKLFDILEVIQRLCIYKVGVGSLLITAKPMFMHLKRNEKELTPKKIKPTNGKGIEFW